MTTSSNQALQGTHQCPVDEFPKARGQDKPVTRAHEQREQRGSGTDPAASLTLNIPYRLPQHSCLGAGRILTSLTGWDCCRAPGAFPLCTSQLSSLLPWLNIPCENYQVLRRCSLLVTSTTHPATLTSQEAGAWVKCKFPDSRSSELFASTISQGRTSQKQAHGSCSSSLPPQMRNSPTSACQRQDTAG